jgi:hypothetical protein
MSTLRNANALIHGVFSRDVILPNQREEDFRAPCGRPSRRPWLTGTLEEDIFYKIALQWKAAPESRPARVRSRAAEVLQPRQQPTRSRTISRGPK